MEVKLWLEFCLPPQTPPKHAIMFLVCAGGCRQRKILEVHGDATPLVAGTTALATGYFTEK